MHSFIHSLTRSTRCRSRKGGHTMRKKDKIPELEDTALLPDAMPASSLPSGSVNGWQVAGARVVTTKLHVVS